MTGKGAKSIYADQPEFLNRMLETFRHKGNSTQELRYRFKSTGEEKYLLMTLAYAPPHFLLVHTQDVTKRKEAETATLMAKEQAEFANRAKSEFLANVSHELRTPLNAIIGFSEMMNNEMLGPLSSKYRDYAADIHDSGKHLLSLINDILDISKIEAGKFELSEEDVDVGQVVAACVRMVQERAQQARVRLINGVVSDRLTIWADRRALKQIVLNLLSNAIKFTPAGGNVTIVSGIGSQGELEISVSDTGIGITADDLPKVLRPFGQADGSLSRKHEGTGLGLTLVASLVELHGGTFTLESELGRGTTARILIPGERVLRTAASAAAR